MQVSATAAKSQQIFFLLCPFNVTGRDKGGGEGGGKHGGNTACLHAENTLWPPGLFA